MCALGQYGDQPIVVILVSATEWLMWRHASQHRLIDPDLTARQIRYFGLPILAPMAVFALSIPVALIFGAAAAELIWALVWVAARLVSQQFKDVAV